MCTQVRCEIRRSIVKTGDDPRTNVGDQPPFDLVKDAPFVAGAHLPPVDGQLVQMRHRCQRIESGMSLRRKAWVSDCRVMEVKREIPRSHAMLIYILKQSMIARPEKNHAVRQIGSGAFVTEMDMEKNVMS